MEGRTSIFTDNKLRSLSHFHQQPRNLEQTPNVLEEYNGINQKRKHFGICQIQMLMGK